MTRDKAISIIQDAVNLDALDEIEDDEADDCYKAVFGHVDPEMDIGDKVSMLCSIPEIDLLGGQA